MEPEVLLIGDLLAAEFHAAREALAANGSLTQVPDVPAALAALAAAQCSPAVIVLAQSYPGQVSDADIERLWRAAPLARILSLLGTWCEGEMRTGRPCAGAIRVYWHQWSARWGQERARLKAGQCPTWGLPVTATDEERVMHPGRAASHRQGLIVIVSPHPAMAEMLCDACRQMGYATLWEPHFQGRPRFQGAQAVVFDGRDCDLEEAAQLTALAHALPGLPILALMDFPRAQDRQRALRHGATAVLSKPLLLDDLWWELEATLEPPQPARAAQQA